MVRARSTLGGAAHGRRRTTQQLVRAYLLLLASHFQGFCRDLHTECAEHFLKVIGPGPAMWSVLQDELRRGRQLDRGNAQPSSLGSDFGRLGIDFWSQLQAHDVASVGWKDDLEALNDWRNAIVHQDFTSPRLGGIMILGLDRVRHWRRSCNGLARAMDEVMRQHMLTLTGTPPW
jgi:hypothetical protein